MKFRHYYMALAVFIAGAALPTVTFAEDVPAAERELTDEQREKARAHFEERWNERYENASDEEKAKMDERRKEFEGLSDEEKREKLRANFEERWNERYENASDEEKAKMDERRKEFESLSEEEKKARVKSWMEKRKKFKGQGKGKWKGKYKNNR